MARDICAACGEARGGEAEAVEVLRALFESDVVSSICGDDDCTICAPARRAGEYLARPQA